MLEAPGRVAQLLVDLAAVCGDRPVVVCRELTKLHEEIWRGSLAAAASSAVVPSSSEWAAPRSIVKATRPASFARTPLLRRCVKTGERKPAIRIGRFSTPCK